jgi:hypothetical protein
MKNARGIGFFLLWTACIAARGAIGQAVLPNNGVTTAKLRSQETTLWCWAASGQMVMSNLGREVKQCIEAQNRFGRKDCCGTHKPAECVQSGWPEFDKYGFAFATTKDTALSWEQLQAEIVTRKSPFAFSWHWRGGGDGHMMVVKGYAIRNGVKYVSILDPWPPNIGDARDITYDSYVSGLNHTHWDDYYQVHLQAPANSGQQPTSLPVANANLGRNNQMSFELALRESRSVALQFLRSSKAFTAPGPGAEPSKPTIGVPFPNVYIGIDSLEAAAASGQPGALGLLSQTNQVLYSIEANGKIKESLLLQKTDDHWADSGEANTAVTRQLVAMRSRYAKQHHLALSAFHSVSIPALNAYFIGVKRGYETILIPVQTDPSIGVVAGRAQTAKVLLPKLAAIAAESSNRPGGVR